MSDISSKKRSHSEMASGGPESTSISQTTSPTRLEGIQEPASKKIKLPDSPSDPVAAIVDLALSRIVVEPCNEASGEKSGSKSVFEPLAGREAEFKLIEEHYRRCMLAQQPQPVFLCGAPGCGKTATVSKIMSSNMCFSGEPSTSSQFAPYSVRVNCATDLVASKPAALYSILFDRLAAAFDASEIAKELKVRLTGSQPPGATEQELLPFILRRINQLHLDYSKSTTNKKPYFILVLLDEVDHILLSKNSLSPELHFLFSCWLQTWGIISIVAISNAHDLFERNLPLLTDIKAVGNGSDSKSSTKAGVLTIPYKPYTPEQLEAILHSRLVSPTQPMAESKNLIPSLDTLFGPKTLKFTCAKVAKLPGDQAGDVRILLDLCKAMLIGARNSKKLPITLDVAAKTWKVKMAPPPSDPILQLSRSQKCVLLCMLYACSKSDSTRASELEANWKAVGARMFASAPDLTELWGAVSLLEGTGDIRIQKEKGNRTSYKLSSKEGVRESLSKDPLLSAFLP